MEPQILPEELLMEILLRLPVKSLVRFKCVSKSCFSLISDPHFARSHFDLASASARTHTLLLFSAYNLKMLSIDFNAVSLHDDSSSSVVNLDSLLPFFEYPVRIVGSCRGFLLFECLFDLLIWNPHTGVHTELPPTPIYSFRYSFLFGFGYDPSTDDYLVTLLTCYQTEDSEGEDGMYRAQIFSSRSNIWQEFQGSHMCYVNTYVNYSSAVGFYFREAVHWPAHHVNRAVDIIVAFDLVERVFFEIPFPNDFDCNIFHCELQVIGGCLSICAERYNDIAGGIWVMEEYKRQSSWTRSHVILPPSNILDRHFSPVCFARNGDIVGLYALTELVKFNDNGDVLERRRYCDHQEDCDCHLIAVMHTESMLSIPCEL